MLASFFEQLKAEGPHLVCPKVLFGKTASIFSALYAFTLTERFPPDRLARLQNEQLHHLLAHAATHVPHYRDTLKRAGFKPGATNADAIWNNIPVLTRHDVRSLGQKLRAETCPAVHGGVREQSTSGSTSQPVTIATTELADFLWTCTNMRERAWQQVDLGGTLVLLADGGKEMGGQPFAELASWSLPSSALMKSGKQFKINPTLPIADLVGTIAKRDPAYIHTRPSQLNLIIRGCRTTGMRFPGLRAVFCVSEVVSQELRASCRDVLGVEIIENYSCAEMGYLALQCPEGGKLHALSELVRFEVLDSDGQPCRPGEIGRVVVTSLHNYAMPLIRYELGDEAEMGAPCSCGRSLPVIERIIGRTQDYLVLPTGNPIRINTYHYRIAAIAKIREFQIVQRSTSRIDIRLAVDMPLDASEERRLITLLEQQGEHLFQVGLVYCESIERTPGGKLRSFVSEIA